MRDLRFRRLEEHRTGGTGDNMELSYPTPHTPSGKTYQYSPNPDAAPRLFLIGDAPDDRIIAPEMQSRIRREPGPGETVCPYSGHMASDEDFVHFEDAESIKDLVEWEMAADVNDWLSELAKDFNRKQPKGGLITMKIEHKPNHQPRPSLLREDLLRNLTCNVCARSYGVYAIALFCPDCGAPNIGLHFRREAELVAAQIVLADRENAEGRAELAYRLMGNAHEDVLTAFETALKTVYRHLVRTHRPGEAKQLCGKKAIGNAFQKIERAREKFSYLGIEPFARGTGTTCGLIEICYAAHGRRGAPAGQGAGARLQGSRAPARASDYRRSLAQYPASSLNRISALAVQCCAGLARSTKSRML